MIIRMVKLHFRLNEVEYFVALFAQHAHLIRQFEGCTHLALWQDTDNPCIFFTHSHWRSATDLAAYRRSALFGSVWKQTKALFAEPAQAWSVQAVA